MFLRGEKNHDPGNVDFHKGLTDLSVLPMSLANFGPSKIYRYRHMWSPICTDSKTVKAGKMLGLVILNVAIM